MELYNRLCTITKQENVMKDEPMKKHTTFRIGGPADYFVTPESKEEILPMLLPQSSTEVRLLRHKSYSLLP